MTEKYKNIDYNLRPLKHVISYDHISQDVLSYTAGLTDADGCFKINQRKTYSLQFSLCQSLKGVSALHFIYDHFGGSINLQIEENGNNQRAYCFSLNGEDMFKFTKAIVDYLILKKREAIKILDFPLDNLHVIPISATKKETNECLDFQNLKKCIEFFGKHLAFQKRDEIIHSDWVIRKKLNRSQIDAITDKRRSLMLQIQQMKNVDHDLIPADIKPTLAYFGGMFDGDGRFSTHGFSGQNHSVNQKSVEICQLYRRTFGGTVCKRNSDGCFVWEIYTGAKDFFLKIAPYVIGKKKQVDLIMNMQPGESMDISIALRDLKGKGCPATSKMDRHKTAPTHKKVKALPQGVFKNECKKPFRAQVQHDKKVYIIGQYATPDEAHQKFMEVKRMIIASKAADLLPDLSHLSLSSVKKAK